MEREADYGLSMKEYFAHFSQDGALLKTSGPLLPEELTEFSGAFPKRGMMLSGVLYELPHLAHLIEGKECSLLERFRTPTARDFKGMSAKSWRERNKGDKTPTLPDQIGGTPHPEFVEELMGYETGWTELKH